MLIAVILKSRSAEARYLDALRLFETAFSEKKVQRTLFSKESDPYVKKVKGADRPLQAQLITDVILEYYPSEEPQIRASLIWKDTKLPIKAGEQVAILRLTDEKENLLVEKILTAQEDVAMTVSHRFLQTLVYYRLWVWSFILLNLVGFALFLYYKKIQAGLTKSEK
jgi:serine-type D-Ala-D-Ala carboxypeptidase (penicillin-binding protein 5/6)